MHKFWFGLKVIMVMVKINLSFVYFKIISIPHSGFHLTRILENQKFYFFLNYQCYVSRLLYFVIFIQLRREVLWDCFLWEII